MRTTLVVLSALVLMVSTASAQDWNPQASSCTDDFKGVCFVDENTGWAVGWDYKNLYATVDGGQNWTTQDPGVLAYFEGVSFCDAKNGMVVGGDGTILYTTDGGANWQTSMYGYWLTMYGCHMPHPNLGIAGGVNTINQPLVHWAKNGDWVNLGGAVFYFMKGGVGHEGKLTDIHSLDDDNWVVSGRTWMGEGAICRTDDGGKTWTTILWHDYAFHGVDFIDGTTGYVVGDKGWIFKTTDAGMTWKALINNSSENLTDVSCASNLATVVVGENGTILRTDDAGMTWNKEDGGTFENLNSVCFTSENSGFAVGAKGTILNYAGGGPKALICDTNAISAATGGKVNFKLDAGTDNGKRDYVLLGSVTGTTPGLPLPGGETLPINYDAFTSLIMQTMNTAAFSNFMGTLDASGLAKAQLDTLGAVDPRFVGTKLYFAFTLYSPYDFVSNDLMVTIDN